jgi:hypothetical protein
MSSSSNFSRRSFLGRITAGSLTGGTLAVVLGNSAVAEGWHDRPGIFGTPPGSDNDWCPASYGEGHADPHDNDVGCVRQSGTSPRVGDRDITDNTRFPNTHPTPRPGPTDQDPTDVAGQGRGSATERYRPRPSGLTDQDWNDASGAGRGRANPGVTDRDPTDPSGHGRGGAARPGLTDRDPADPAGGGRGTGANGPR